jgi:UDP-N-acetylmuramyl pentapeptide synthase
MRPVLRDGVTFIQDDVKAPLWSLGAAFDFLAEAEAPRKIAVIGTISDYPGSSARTYVRTARRALEVADEVIFAGPLAGSALKADAEALRAFPTASEAAEYLRSSLREGDLVLIKGSGEADGLEQVVLAR